MRTDFIPPAIARSCKGCQQPTPANMLNGEGLCGLCRTYLCKTCGRRKPRGQMVTEAHGLRITTKCRACRNEQRAARRATATVERKGGARGWTAPVPSDPAPVQALAALLIEARSAGEDFEAAWDRCHRLVLGALKTSARQDWRLVFEWGEKHWRAAYEGDGRSFRVSPDLLVHEAAA